MSDLNLLVLLTSAAFVLGCACTYAWTHRRIDHRWYCGASHRACESCEASESWLAFSAKWQAEHPDRTPEALARLRRAGRAFARELFAEGVEREEDS
jgi:hypothetical protein